MVTEGLEQGQLKLLAGKSAVLASNRAVKRVSVTEPEIAAVNVVGGEQRAHHAKEVRRGAGDPVG